MPPARRWAAPCLCWWSLSQELRGSSRGSSRSVCLWARFALSPPDCIRTGRRDRSGRTACRNEVQIRILDTARPVQPGSAVDCRTARNARPCAYRAYSADAAQKCCHASMPRVSAATSVVRSRNPGNPADGICGPTSHASPSGLIVRLSHTTNKGSNQSNSGPYPRTTGSVQLCFTYPGATIAIGIEEVSYGRS